MDCRLCVTLYGQRFSLTAYLIAVIGVVCISLIGCNVRTTSSNTTSSNTTGIDADVSIDLDDRINVNGARPVARHRSEAMLDYLRGEDPDGMARAVIVQGYPLVHTRQILPVNSNGELVAAESAAGQIEQVLENLEAVLTNAGSSFEQLVRVNIYANSPETATQARQQLSQRIPANLRPAVSSVITALPVTDAMIAMDVVGTAAEKGSAVNLQRCESIAGDAAFADASVLPWGGVVYVSGQVAKGELVEATQKSLTALQDTINEIAATKRQIVQLKVFLQPVSATNDVRHEIAKAFRGQLVPPISFVEWTSSAPIEIEMVVRLPLTGPEPMDSVRFFTPDGVAPAPTFSRVAIVNTDRQIYISGLKSNVEGDGNTQVRDVFSQLQQILSETGSDLWHLAKATYYVSNDDASTMLDELRAEYYDADRPPAASKVTVNGVGNAERTVSMDMIAVGNGK